MNKQAEEGNKRAKRILQLMNNPKTITSRTISKFADLNVSSATIRNEMSDLTDMGYIVQPHTSAGRIPSDKGYRLYVDELMKETELSISELMERLITLELKGYAEEVSRNYYIRLL